MGFLASDYLYNRGLLYHKPTRELERLIDFYVHHYLRVREEDYHLASLFLTVADRCAGIILKRDREYLTEQPREAIMEE